MRDAEKVTFGGSGLDRAAELRTRPEDVALMPSEVILLWRGKILTQAPNLDRLARLDSRHSILQEASEDTVLVGRQEDGRLILARDISTWEPEAFDPADIGGFFDKSEQTHPALSEDMVFAELRRIMTRLSPREAEIAATAKAIFAWHKSHGFCAKCGTKSDFRQYGWQRTCEACGAHHFPRTDPVVIMLITRGNRVLMGRSVGWPEGMYSLLAGFVEPGETIEAAVRREVAEEAGIKVGAVEYLASQPWPFPASLMFGCRGEALSEEIEIDPLEIEDAFWVTREDIMLAFAGEHPKLMPARRGAIAHFLLRYWLADKI
ncbi:MAG: NAD(+) diphosphatase [Pseudomonadota bacterium]